MRKYRMGLIQTPEQLRFSYQAIIEGAKQLSQPPSDNQVCLNSLSHISTLNNRYRLVAKHLKTRFLNPDKIANSVFNI